MRWPYVIFIVLATMLVIPVGIHNAFGGQTGNMMDFQEIINLRSGNTVAVPPEFSQDLEITVDFIPGTSPPTLTQLNNACNAPNAFVIPALIPPWIQSLPADPNALWINDNPSNIAPNSPRLIYCDKFMISSSSILSAKLDFSWAVDNRVEEVFLNGVALGISSSSATSQTQVTNLDVSPPIVQQGLNKLQIEYINTGTVGGVTGAGLIYSATLTVTSEPSDEIIGGEIIPIDSAVLLLAGTQTSFVWILPVILAGACFAAFSIRRK